MKILCVEDDQSLASLLEQTLSRHHYQVDLANSGENGLDLAEVVPYDLILLDWNLPKLDGVAFCQKLRANGHSASLLLNRDTPIILMTALDEVTNKVVGLDAGADDYLVKPFDLEELLARIRALLRRKSEIRSPLLTWGDLVLNPYNCHVTYQGREVSLTSKQYELLELFLRNPEQIFSIQRLLDRLWTLDNPPTEGAVRAQIKGLRHQLRDAGVPEIVETTYKLGYRLKNGTIDDRQKEGSLSNQCSEVVGFGETRPQSSLCSVIPELQELWEEYRPSYCDRLVIIEDMVRALKMGTLTTEQQQRARGEVHTMLGSLGSFGLETASEICLQIQPILRQQKPLQASQAEGLEQLLKRLRYELENYPHQTSLSQKSLSSFQTYTPSRSISTKLLIVDEDLNLAQQIASEAMLRGFQTAIAPDMQRARQLLTTEAFDLILLDLNFSESIKNGLDFLASIRENYPQIPVIILTFEESLNVRVEASRLGIKSFLQKPLAPAQILTTVLQMLGGKHPPVFRILVVDDDRTLLALVSSLLRPLGYQVISLNEPEQFWETLEQAAPDLLILDVELYPGYPSGEQEKAPLNGFDLCQVIRNDPRWNLLPVLFLSSHNEPEIIQRGFSVGADDFLQKPITASELLSRVRTRLDQRKLWQMSEIDELTGVSLRRKLLQDLTRLLHLAQRHDQFLSLALLDIDHFKNVNDLYGHEIGDRVLEHLGQLLNQSFRKEDLVGRWGGEEFLIAMYHTTKNDGLKRLEQVLENLRQHQFVSREGVVFSVTFSGGIAQFPGDGEDTQTLYHAADLALYAAKAKGRNCILSTQLIT